ncbi:MAG: fibronectin type III domain-containing protein [Patescibacteria group bacterium]
MKVFLILCSWPAYLTKTQQESFAEFAGRDERGLYLESYSQHIRYYRAAVTSFLSMVALIGLIFSGITLLGLAAFEPVRTTAKTDGQEAVSCLSPGVVMSWPEETTYCNTGDEFDIISHWYGYGTCLNTHNLYWMFVRNQSTNVDMLPTGTELTAPTNPMVGYSENQEAWTLATCQTTGKYQVGVRSENNKYSSKLWVYVNPPASPTNIVETEATDTSITVSWTDNSNNEERFRVQRQTNVTPSMDCDAPTDLGTANVDQSSYYNNNLTANTGYCYQVRAENGNGNTDYTSAVKTYTLPVAPNLSADRSASTWYNTPSFQFTNSAGWNEGGVRYYRSVWDTNPTHTWADTESLWSEAENDCPPFDGGNGSCGATGNTITETAVSEGNSLYLHVQSYNYAGANNGSHDYGPFYYDATPPGSPSAVRDGTGSSDSDWSNDTTTLSGAWEAATDNLSGIQKYQYAIGTTAGATDVVNWTDNGATTSVSAASLALENEQTYYLTIRSVDQAGNTGSETTSDGITIDTEAATPASIVAAPARTSVTITWTTNELTTTQLEWGTTEVYGNLTSENAELTTAHEVTLTGLNENTPYHFRVRGTDRAGNSTTGLDETFTTTELEPTIITNTASEVLSTTSVRITWTTNHPATSRVRYGRTTAYGAEVSDTELVTSHRLTLTGLTAGQTYHYEVLSVGNTSANDADATFTTLAATTLSGLTVEVVDEHTATVSWTTNHGANSKVEYGVTTAYGKEITESGLTTAHSVLLTGLTPETTYHYRATSAGNTTVTSADQSFMTPAETEAPTDGKVIRPTIISPTASQVTIKTKPIITGVARSGNTVLVYIDNVYNGKTMATTHSSGTGSFAYTPFLDLRPGWHSVFVKAEDASGKKSAATSAILFKVELPYVPPTIIQPEVHDGANPTIVLTGVAKNDSIIRVMLDGEVIKEIAVTNSPSGTASFNCEISTDGTVAVGTHSVTLVALDKNGKTSNATEPVVFTKTAVTSVSSSVPRMSFGESVSYTVQSGDSLWKIAEKYIGQGIHYNDIAWANRDRYPSLSTNPSYILPGWKLIIPGK